MKWAFSRKGLGLESVAFGKDWPPLDDVKRRAIMAALDACDGDVVLAAKKLGIGRSTLYQYLVDQKYNRPLEQAARKKGKP